MKEFHYWVNSSEKKLNLFKILTKIFGMKVANFRLTFISSTTLYISSTMKFNFLAIYLLVVNTCGDSSSERVSYFRSPPNTSSKSQGSLACDYDILIRKDTCAVRWGLLFHLRICSIFSIIAKVTFLNVQLEWTRLIHLFCKINACCAHANNFVKQHFIEDLV